jgi:RNA recognition motif-containing protein
MDFNAGMKRSADGFDTDPKRQKVGASRVLHVRGLPHYATEAELQVLVAPFGTIAKILILHDKNQAFIQMMDVVAATGAVESFEYQQPQIRAKNVYVQFSSRQEIEVRAGAPGATGGQGSEEGASCTLIVAVSNVTVPVTLDNVHEICKPYGDVLKIITFNKNMDFQALVQFATVEQATNAKMFLDGKDLFQGCCHLRLAYSKRQNLVIKQNDHKSRDFTQNAAPMGGALMGMQGMQNMPGMPMGMGGQFGMGGQQQQQQQMGYGGMPQQPGQAAPGASCVVLVNKLDVEKVTCDMLFSLFGVYGDVLRVKILYNKRDTAMIQYATTQQATFAHQNLNGCPLFGQELVVTKSRHQDIKLPREEDGKELTRDYTGSPDHRFKNKNFINQKNVNAPSLVLHVANIHDEATAQELTALFGSMQPTATAPVVEFFKTSKAMAYVAMNTAEEAVMALVSLHNYKLRNYPLRVSFSHKDAATLVASVDAAAEISA